MKKQIDQLIEFQERHGFAVEKKLPMGTLLPETGEEMELNHLCGAMLRLAKALIGSKDLRMQRASLMLEELVETIYAMMRGDVVELADGLADLAYVVIGSAVTYGIPLDAVFEEVHESNMTKPVTGEPLLKGKASKSGTFRRADVAGVLRRHGRIQ